MKISYEELQRCTGKGYRTIKKRLDEAGLQPVGYGDGPGKAILWDSKQALEAIYAPMTTQDGLDPSQEKAKLDKERRKTQEMKNAELKGKLLPVEDVVELWTRQILAAKTKILGIKSKCAPVFSNFFEDQGQIKTILDIIDFAAHDALSELIGIDHKKGR